MTIDEQDNISIWTGWTKEAYSGVDEYGEPRWAQRKFYRCKNCRNGTVVQTNYCANCGAKMIREEVKA